MILLNLGACIDTVVYDSGYCQVFLRFNSRYEQVCGLPSLVLSGFPSDTYIIHEKCGTLSVGF